MALTRPNVELHIEELVLHGFAASDRHAIATAVEAELGRLLAVEGLPASFEAAGMVGRVDAPSFEVTRDSAPSQLGQDIARSVYRGLGE